ncbi:(Fe-S)-binding protein [Methanolobus sp. WCC5]|uniref:(Fe-S)-binding protein n=1 Tax=Methanolobus sp. WCC5 TaxID=3125785 RepID=UPI003252CCD6
MPGSPEEMKLVSNAMSNAIRRKIMTLLKDSSMSREDMSKAIGHPMLDYHLQLLQQAGLTEIMGEKLELTDFGRNMLEPRNKKPVEPKKDLLGTKPIEVVEIRQFLPCIADNSKYRIIARMEPPLEGAVKLLEPLYPRARYSENLGVLIIQKGSIIITVYSTGNVTMTMISDTDEAEEILNDLMKSINDAIRKGIKASSSGEKVRVDHNEIYKYLPGTNCHICGEQSCYSFAIRLMAKETTLDRCTPLLEQKYTVNLEHLKVLMEYL